MSIWHAYLLVQEVQIRRALVLDFGGRFLFGIPPGPVRVFVIPLILAVFVPVVSAVELEIVPQGLFPICLSISCTALTTTRRALLTLHCLWKRIEENLDALHIVREFSNHALRKGRPTWRSFGHPTITLAGTCSGLMLRSAMMARMHNCLSCTRVKDDMLPNQRLKNLFVQPWDSRICSARMGS